MILGKNISKVYNKGKEIQKVYSYGKLVWDKQSSEDIDYSTTPFTITAVTDDVRVSLTLEGSFSFKYKINNGGWLSCDTSEYINLKKDDALYISALPPSNSKVKDVFIYGLADVSGNIMSLCYGDDFVGKTELQKDSIFSGVFSGCDIRNAKNLILPATTLTEGCYQHMFYVCSKLTTAPELPATTLAYDCYNSMFSGCINLTQAPELPATTLAEYCYRDMFSNCESLTQAPKLPATTLAQGCYKYMFSGCTNLTQAPELPATTLADYCYESMFYDCRNLTQAPELPATTLVDYCYDCMFDGCSKLNYIKAMFKTTPSDRYTYNWVYGVSSTGTFVKNKNATWDVIASSENDYIGIPSGWTVEYI